MTALRTSLEGLDAPRTLLREERQAMADADGACDTPGCECGGRRPRCEDCGQPCDLVDWQEHDGHGPQCPHGDLGCEVRVCDAQHDDPAVHAGCETQADRDTRAGMEQDEAVAEQRAEWAADDQLAARA